MRAATGFTLARSTSFFLGIWEFPKIRGTLFGGPHNKDHSFLGSMLGSPYFGKLLYRGSIGLSRWLSNYGPFLVTLDGKCGIIIGIQKGP